MRRLAQGQTAEFDLAAHQRNRRGPRILAGLVQLVPPDLDASLFEEVKRGVVERVVYIENHLNDSAVDDHFGAHETRGKGGVEGAILDAGSMVG